VRDAYYDNVLLVDISVKQNLVYNLSIFANVTNINSHMITIILVIIMEIMVRRGICRQVSRPTVCRHNLVLVLITKLSYNTNSLSALQRGILISV